MKKIKLLTSLVGLTGLSMGLVPMISGCSCGNKQITPELTGDKSVKIKESNIVKGQESTVTLSIPEGKVIDTLVITIGEKTLKQGTDYKINNNKITISADAVTGEKVSIKVTLKSAAKTASITYDNQSFTTAGITINSKTDSISAESEEKSKITISCNTGSDESKGIVQIYNGETLLQETDLNTVTATESSIVIKFNKWDELEDATQLTVKFNRSYFGIKSWTQVAQACNEFEAIDNPDDSHAHKLATFITGNTYIAVMMETAQECLQRIVAGDEGSWQGVIEINKQLHKIRCIDAMHDELVGSSDKTAVFTFELVTLLSDSNGNKITSKWDAANNYDYTNSILRKNLNGTDDKASWGDGTVADTRTAWQMLPSELQLGIKTVKKTVATTNAYQLTEYSDKLFPLTYTEMAQSGGTAKVEGTAYKYWTDHNTDNDRIKLDVTSSPSYYRLVSPYTSNSAQAWGVDSGGHIDYYNVANGTSFGVSFGFCI